VGEGGAVGGGRTVFLGRPLVLIGKKRGATPEVKTGVLDRTYPLGRGKDEGGGIASQEGENDCPGACLPGE